MFEDILKTTDSFFAIVNVVENTVVNAITGRTTTDKASINIIFES